jgi:hypothetical protein
MKKINLSIPKPCHENWDKMTPSDKGRFCGSCQKTVVDFTSMSDRQIAEFFKRPTGSVCGHFHADQLQRDISIPNKRVPWVKYFFQFSLPAFLISMKASAQGKVAVKEEKVACTKLTGDTVFFNGQAKASCTQIKGKVTNAKGDPIPFVSVWIKNSAVSTQTDKNGNFVIATNKDDVVLVASAVGYNAVEIRSNNTVVNITMDPVAYAEMGIVAVSGGVVRRDKLVEISGKVIDQSGDGVPFATVKVKDTHTEIKTDEQGHFQLDANNGAVLSATAIGYDTNEITIGRSSSVTITIRARIDGGVYVTRKNRKTKKQRAEVINEQATAPKVDPIESPSPFNPLKETLPFQMQTHDAAAIDEPLKCIVAGDVSPMVQRNPGLIEPIKTVIDTTFKKLFVYPNPAHVKSTIHIDLKKLDAGTYTVSIIDMSGEVIQTEEVTIENKKHIIDLNLEETAAGTYFIHVFNRKTAASHSEKIIVQ